MRETEFLNALHICLGINIKVYDTELNIVKAYTSKDFQYTEYDDLALIKSVNNNSVKSDYLIFVDANSTMFTLIKYDNCQYLFGPFMAEISFDEILEAFLKENNIIYKKWDSEVYQDLQVFALHDNHEIRKLIHDFNFLIIAYLNDEHLTNYIDKLQATVMDSNLDKLLFVEKDFANHEHLYETKVLDLVKKGCINQVEETLTKIDNRIKANRNAHTFRSEKNFSIILFEKLSQIAIEKGMDIRKAIKARDQLIIDNEGTDKFINILKIRNGAILFFTQKVHELIQKELSPFLLSVISFINDNLYNNTQVSHIAEVFNVSQTTLNLTFKNELGITVKKYISRTKLEDSKKLLEKNFSVIEISQMLGFVDSSHFSKKFKNTYKMTPTEYKRRTKNRIFKI